MKGLALLVRTAFAADRMRAVGAFGAGVFESFCRVSFAFWMSLFMTAAARADLSACVVSATGYGLSLALVGASNMFRVEWTMRLQEKAAFLVDQQLMRLSAGLPEIEHHERPDYMGRMSLLRQDRAELGHGLWSLIGLVQTLASVVMAVSLLVTVDPWVPLLLIVSALPSVFANRKIAAVTTAGGDRGSAELRLAHHLSELGSSPEAGKELRAFGLGQEVLQRYRRAWSAYDKARSAAERTAAALGVAGLATFGLGYCGALVLAAVSSADEPAPTRVGQITLAFVVASQINQLVTTAGFNLTALSRSLACYGRVQWLIGHGKASRAALAPATAPAPLQITQGITFTEVGFSYPGGGRPVLSDVNLFIPAGSTVALVGENGAGKSTLVKLLARFYRPTEGQITIDGTDLSTIGIEQWRARLAGGFQDFMHFEFVAAETVGVGDLSRVHDQEAIRMALARAQSDDVPGRLPQGLDTRLGRSFGDGTELSGGQWQKLALGRAMMRTEPLLMVLDEPTASLDAETEHRIFEAQAAAARAAGARTGAITLLVSHRFSTTRTADLIAVVQDGRITQYGSHDQLVAAGGLYAELYAIQADSYR